MKRGIFFMETYNYDAAAVPEGDADTTPAAAPETDAAAAGTSDTAQSGFKFSASCYLNISGQLIQ